MMVTSLVPQTVSMACMALLKFVGQDDSEAKEVEPEAEPAAAPDT